jgi:hypothetical protein
MIFPARAAHSAKRHVHPGTPHRGLAGLAVAILVTGLALASGAEGESGGKVPELARRPASHWINSQPLTLESLRGKVVILEVWTFG